MRKIAFCLSGIFAAASPFSAKAEGAIKESVLHQIVDETIMPIMKSHKIPGMAVAITVNGKHYFFPYGIASRESGERVSENTLFEIGSLSKTFTATLGGLGVANGAFNLSDPATKYLPELANSGFDTITMLDLATYSAGGLPLQFPDSVTDEKSMVDYYKGWKADYPRATKRLYSNPSIGLFGYLAAQSMNEPFETIMEKKLLPEFALKNTFIHVPENRMQNYAYGYSKADKAVRVSPGALDAQAYGIKTTALDLIHFVHLNINNAALDRNLQNAVAATQTGYYRVGDMMQGLGWELYNYPVDLKTLVSGNSADMALKPQKIEKLDPPLQSPNVFINKTGSTGGFGAYAAFIPAQKIGVVLLANRNYPNQVRVEAGYRILQGLNSKR
ncbi:class C beta-lactamase [Brucella sp. BE17]|uniref:class C beta-lactamase n=1 Tax=Brucella sp. BE17 TaxID=3142977 RepID=UPI0031BBADE0